MARAGPSLLFDVQAHLRRQRFQAHYTEPSCFNARGTIEFLKKENYHVRTKQNERP